jgi:UDP-N-acetylmuramoyl-L-alanyl-D-glutamate--2,6-diaminopimelate ligase
LIYKGECFSVETPLLGKHNISNILGAVALLFSLGFSLSDIIKLTPSFKRVEGRLEEVVPDVFVDYAHTPDSLRKTLLALKDIGYKKIICVFGCGGDRDKGKRKIMGEIACDCSDFTFITSDNPRSEDPLDICKEIQKGFRKDNYSVIPDRKEAIREADKLRKRYRNTCLLVAGKGHEEYQIIGDKKIPFKDSIIIRQLFKEC